MSQPVPEKVEVKKPNIFEEGFPLTSALRDHSTYTLGVLLTAVEAALGDSKQATALKAIVRREMFALMDRNQAEVYERTGQQERGLQPKETRVVGQDEVKVEEE